MNTPTFTDILGSPVISVILSLFAGGIGAAIVGVYKILSRISLLESQLTRLSDKLTEAEKDLDVIKWGAVAGANVVRQQQFPPSTEIH